MHTVIFHFYFNILFIIKRSTTSALRTLEQATHELHAIIEIVAARRARETSDQERSETSAATSTEHVSIDDIELPRGPGANWIPWRKVSIKPDYRAEPANRARKFFILVFK